MLEKAEIGVSYGLAFAAGGRQEQKSCCTKCKFVFTDKSDVLLPKIFCKQALARLHQEPQVMNVQLLFENGKGSVVDGYGKPEPMNYIVDEK